MWPCNLEYIVWLKAEAYASFSLQEGRDGADSMLSKNWERLYDSMRWLGIRFKSKKDYQYFYSGLSVYFGFIWFILKWWVFNQTGKSVLFY